MKILVTGVAGFIGSRVAQKLLGQGCEVAGIDCFTDYYARPLKELNLKPLLGREGFTMLEQDILDADLPALLHGCHAVIHLAAQAGVRKSWAKNFEIYTKNNVLSTQAILEAGVQVGLPRVVYAGSSSVYGDTTDLPARETSVCWPVSPYGVTKLAAEHLCLLYTRNFGLQTASLRYFTVYGPGQRPDMAFHRFIRAMLTGGEIRLFGDGGQSRDFTFVGDIVDATVAAATIDSPVKGVYNIGGGSKASVNQVLDMLQSLTNGNATINRLPVAKGDVRDTWADTARARQELGFAPKFSLESGLAAQVEWMKEALPLLEEIDRGA